MKKYLASALVLALMGASFGISAQSAVDHAAHQHTGPQTTNGEHASHGPGGMDSTAMQAMRQDMQQKMSAAKTDDERQALMTAQKGRMQETMKMENMKQGMQMPMGDHAQMHQAR